LVCICFGGYGCNSGDSDEGSCREGALRSVRLGLKEVCNTVSRPKEIVPVIFAHPVNDMALVRRNFFGVGADGVESV